MIVAECTFSPGKLEAFKNLAQETMDAVKAGSKVVGYQWYFNSDQTKCYIVEQYSDPSSLISYLEVLGPHLLKLLKVQDDEIRNIRLHRSPRVRRAPATENSQEV
jgi:quinol monooxygenase YgiN